MEDAEKPKIGRPSSYTPEITEKIAELLANGETIVDICDRKDMPSLPTFYRWFREHDDFNKVYTRAREERCYTYADEIIQIADECEVTSEAVNQARLKIDARKWIAVKYLPKVFGERVEHEHTTAAIQVNVLNKLGSNGESNVVSVESSGEAIAIKTNDDNKEKS